VAADAETTMWFEPESDPRLQSLAHSLPLLPEEQREVVVLKIWGDLTFDEIGEQMQISPNTAASRWRYAMEALKKFIIARTHE
jgi:RNA polymerase sigma-70 factor (ECF subfamily)